MNNSTSDQPPSLLEQISTHWPLISDPLQFVLRYASAVRLYIAALIKDAHEAEDATQNFLLHMLKQPIVREQVRSGRFRDYLKAVLRNAAFTHLRRMQKSPDCSALLEQLPDQAESAADDVWITEWRKCLLQRAWEALEQRERQAPDGLAYTVLRLSTDYPDEDSTALAARATAVTGHELRADAFRKQLSRARRHFAQFIVDVIRQTLIDPRPRDVIDELADLGLMSFVQDFLPETYRPH